MVTNQKQKEEKVQCPDCGTWVQESKLAGHQKKRCPKKKRT